MTARRLRGYTLVELLAAMGVFGALLAALAPLGLQVMRETDAATERAKGFEQRWETVRRIRLDAARATSARTRQDWQGEQRVLELQFEGAEVTWIAHEGWLQRLAPSGPVMQAVELDMTFGLERHGGRPFLAYTLKDAAGTVTGRVHLAGLP